MKEAGKISNYNSTHSQIGGATQQNFDFTHLTNILNKYAQGTQSVQSEVKEVQAADHQPKESKVREPKFTECNQLREHRYRKASAESEDRTQYYSEPKIVVGKKSNAETGAVRMNYQIADIDNSKEQDAFLQKIQDEIKQSSKLQRISKRTRDVSPLSPQIYAQSVFK